MSWMCRATPWFATWRRNQPGTAAAAVAAGRGLGQAQPASRWRRLVVGDGSKGPKVVRALEAWVQTKDEDGRVGAAERLVVIRTVERGAAGLVHAVDGVGAVAAGESGGRPWPAARRGGGVAGGQGRGGLGPL